MMRDLYLVGVLKAQRVNLLTNDYVAGLPSPLAFLGLVDLVARQLGLEPWSARVLPILHSVHISSGRTKPEMEPKSKAFSPIETPEDMVGAVEISLLVHMPGCPGEAFLRERILGKRIAGGVIQSDSFSVKAVTPDGSALRGARRGYAMVVPEQLERRFITSGDRTPEQPGLRRIADLLYPQERPEGFGWIVPTAVGYRLLENPNEVPKRSFTRSKSIPHVYAEPVLGIVELISVRNPRLTSLSMEEMDRLLWSWDARGEWILGHPLYHQEPAAPSVSSAVPAFSANPVPAA